jgi:hypothetical protein
MPRVVGDYIPDYNVLSIYYVARIVSTVEKLLEKRGVPRDQWVKYRAFAVHVTNISLRENEYELVVGS